MRLAHVGLVGLSLVGCKPAAPNATTPSDSARLADKPAPTRPPVKPVPPRKPGELVVRFSDAGFASPTAALHDAAGDVYLVTNVSASPTEPNGHGFVSRLSPDGKVIDLKWIESGKKGAVLNAPKGIAAVEHEIYVADNDTVRVFDRETGAPKSSIAISGATSLTSIAAVPGSRIVFVSDSGYKMGKKGLEPSGTDAVYRIDDGVVSTLAKNGTKAGAKVDLHHPSGLAICGTFICVAPFDGRAMYGLDVSGGQVAPLTVAPTGKLYGILETNDRIFVSSREANAVFLVTAPFQKPVFKPFVEDAGAPGEMAIDGKRNRLVVPLATKNAVDVYAIDGEPGSEANAAAAAAADALAAHAAKCTAGDVRGPFTNFSDAPVVALGLTCEPGATQCFQSKSGDRTDTVCKDGSGAITCSSTGDPKARTNWGYACCISSDAGYKCYWFQ